MIYFNHGTRYSQVRTFNCSVWGTEVRPHDSAVLGLLKCNCHPYKEGLRYATNDSQLFRHNGSLILKIGEPW